MSSPKIELSGDESVWTELNEYLQTQRLNGSLEAVLTEITHLRLALRSQVSNILCEGGISEEKLMGFINCYDIPHKVREAVAYTVRQTIKKSLPKIG